MHHRSTFMMSFERRSMYYAPERFNTVMQLFDAHCHLQDKRLLPHLDTVMERADQAGVTGLMCCGSCEEDWTHLPGIARRFPKVHLSFGLHPWYSGGRSARWLDRLRESLTSTPSAVGEIGLDHALDKGTFPDQESVFLAQLHLANELRRPVTFHCRRAWGRLMELLDDNGWPASGFVIHSYSGPGELVEPLVRRGAYLSFSGAITFAHNRKGREAVTAVPLDCLLIETDAPDLIPAQATPLQDASGKPANEPAFLGRILTEVANLRGLPEGALADATRRNAEKLWGQDLGPVFSRTA
jgi:TatD DNase family protein